MEATQTPERWRDTKLWDQLGKRCGQPAETLKLVLADALPRVEVVLNKGGAPPNFTLHDAEHSYRVAERMAALAGEEQLEQIGPHDLAMLLLSAFLHDVGMTPKLSKLERHYAYILGGEEDQLDEEERDELQVWLDDEWNGLVPPLAKGTPSAEELRRAQQILAGYVRFRHNDWSEEWIREELRRYAEKLYPGWIDDLVLLCRSHHFSIDQLKSGAFDPRRVGNPASVLHLRYCASLLRVADVLDFDPERTPRVLFAHRAIEGESVIFWHKDHGLGFEQDGSVLSIDATPEDALTHHAINLTIADVDRELLGCRRLADETQLQRMSGREQDLPHRWRMETSVRARVTPREGTYEYIDGTFRPDPERLLELVGGVELYGSPLAAVRELLQNAFDAVRDQIARQRLAQENPGDPGTGELLARTHRVSLVLERVDGTVRLICSDTGSGMSREIIRSRFLVGGKRANHEMRALERTCAEHGFSTGKTARFGIGVLSYFLIASRLKLKTRRSIEADDPDGTGWTFASTGLDDFGELQRAPHAQVGTEIALAVRGDLLEDPDKFAGELRDYLVNTLRRVPCKFTFDAPGFDLEPIANDLGWIDRERALADRLVKSMVRMPRESAFAADMPTTAKQRLVREQREEGRLDLRRSIREAVSLDVHEGELPDGLGVYRVFFSHFAFQGHSTAAFLQAPSGESGVATTPIERYDGLEAPGGLYMSWNGMTIGVEGAGTIPSLGRLSNVFIEIDWCSDAAGRLAVDRGSFEPSDAAYEATAHLQEAVDEIQLRFVRSQKASPLALLDARILKVATDDLSPVWLGYPSEAEPTRRRAAPLAPPLVEKRATPYDFEGLRWRGKEVSEVGPVKLDAHQSYDESSYFWHGGKIAPCFIAAGVYQGKPVPIPVWAEIALGRAGGAEPGLRSAMPPEWEQLAGLSILFYERHALTVWNESHPVVRACDQPAWDWASRLFPVSINPLRQRETLTRSPAHAAAWLMRCLLGDQRAMWEGLVENEADFLDTIWEHFGDVPGDGSLWFLKQTATRVGQAHVSTSGWDVQAGSTPKHLGVADGLPVPSEEWLLTYGDGSRELRR